MMVENNGYLRRRILMISLLLTLSAGAAFAQTTSFTYQGRLTDGGTAANGNYDLQFALFDSAQGVAQIGVTQIPNVSVSAGIFTVPLDFGATAFPGAPRFLEISARPTGTPSFTTLAPRQQITSTPYAVRSLNASSADNVTVSGVPAGSANYVQNNPPSQQVASFNISGNGTAGGTISASTVNATTQYNLQGSGAFSVTGGGFFAKSNTFVGILAGVQTTPSGSTTAGNFNSFFGREAGAGNTTGGGNSYFGNSAGGGVGNQTGFDNSFFGFSTGSNNSSGSSNSFFGRNAGLNNQSGSFNTLVGWQAGLSNTSESNNTFLGAQTNGAAGITNATAVGAGSVVTQSNSVVLGNNANVGIGTTAPTSRLHVIGNTNLVGNLTVSGTLTAQLSSGDTNYIQNRTSPQAGSNFNISGNGVIGGNVGIGTSSPAVALEVQRNSNVASNWQTGQLRISGASDPNMQLILGYDTSSNLGVIQAGQAFTGFKILSLNPVDGNVGIGTTIPDQKLSVNGNASKSGGGSWLTFSDERLKNITGRFTPGLRAVMQLQPLRYEYRRNNALELKPDGEHVGFSAQAVQRVIPEAVTRNEKGFLLVNNDPIMLTMLNAIKEQQAQIQQQQQQIKQQNEQARQQRVAFAAQQQQLDALKKLLCRSHRRARVCR